ncbi:MAG: single-stranded DNA-binding protein [Halanaerobiales bacterium]|nr:single-stranded DNA-binding protein [Halanaerobiales bacterium]
MLNHVVLIGRLVRDPELRYTSNGTPVSNFTLAVERRFANQQGERDVDFIRIVTWRKLAETCAHHLGKGRLVAIEGSIQVRKSEKDGRTYLNTEIIANEVRFLDWPADSKGSSGSNYKNNNNNNNNNNDNNSFDLDDDFDVPF